MASPGIALLKQGVKPWNEWRKSKDGSPDLSGADLRNCDLTGADLRGANLSNAILRGAKLGQGTFLWNANLSGADLYQANLRGADLQDVNFSGSDLFQADLRESNLQGADLSAAKGGLLSKQLASSDLTGAKLPEPLAKLYDGLSQVKEISSSAQKLFLALLAGCLYSWLTIAQTTDVELITNRATTPLPIIQAAIPIVGFYVVAPLILLCLYFYFHFYLQKLWEELGSLPAIFTDGRELHKSTDPWLLNDLVRSRFVKLKVGRPFLSHFQAWISVLLAWWLVPITLFLFWGRYLRRHDSLWSLFHALLLAISIIAALRLYHLANGTLRGHERTAFLIGNIVKRPSTYLRMILATALGAFFALVSARIIYGEGPFQFRIVQGGPMGSELRAVPNHSRETWIPHALGLIGYSPFANLSGADISIRPPTLTVKESSTGIDEIKGASLRNGNLRYANANASFLVNADLFQADLKGISLAFSDLRQSSLKLANLEGANLSSASMQRANIAGANIAYARAWNANLAGSDLTKSSLLHTDLSGADLTGNDLWHCDLRGAVFENANLEGTNFTFADVTDSNFQNANLRYAYFVAVERGLTKDGILKARNWKYAFFRGDMLHQLGLPPDHNVRLEEQLCSDTSAVINAMIPLNCATSINGHVKSPLPKTQSQTNDGRSHISHANSR